MKRLDLKTGFLCNNNCLFCVQADNKLLGNRSFNDICYDLNIARENCDSVVLTGGEVSIRKDFFDILAFAKARDYKSIQVQTNARMFSYYEFTKRSIASGMTEFAPALHGATKEIHDSLTQSPGSFDQVLSAIKHVKSFNIKVITNTVITKSNYLSLPNIADLLISLKVDQFQLAFPHPIGNAGRNFEKIVPRMTDCIKYIKAALDIGKKNSIFCMVEGMPFCLMEGYFNTLSENYIPKTEIRTVKDFISDYDFTRVNECKTKFSFCKSCKMGARCEGVWKEYPLVYGSEEFKPL